MKGKLFLIPTYLDEGNTREFIAPLVSDLISNLDLFLVENVRTARRFISSLKLGVDISTLRFETLNKRSTADDVTEKCFPLLEGQDIGLMSEAGLPALADPGNLAVSWAHQNSISVVPLPGSSSIQLALIASGFNGQQFTFHGYIPIDKEVRVRKIRELETVTRKTGYTQLFMETPFRNNQLIDVLLKTLGDHTLMSIAAGISANSEFIRTRPISEWRKQLPDLHKIPAVFSIGTFPD